MCILLRTSTPNTKQTSGCRSADGSVFSTKTEGTGFYPKPLTPDTRDQSGSSLTLWQTGSSLTGAVKVCTNSRFVMVCTDSGTVRVLTDSIANRVFTDRGSQCFNSLGGR